MLKPNAEEINIYEDFVSDLNITRNVRQSITNVLGIKIIDSLKEGMVMKDSTNMAYEEEFNSWRDLLKEYIKENNLSKYENDIMYYYEFEEFKNLKKFMEKRDLDLEFDDIYKLYTDGEIELEESFIEKNRKYTKDSLKGDNKMKKIVSLKKTTIDSIKKSIKDSEYIGNAKIINADELPNLNDKDKRYNHPAKVTKVKKVGTEKGYDIYEVTYQETESIRHGEGIDTYRFKYAVKNNSTNDSKEDLGWISTPKLLEREDFKSEDAFEYWVEKLTELKNATNKKDRLDLAQTLMGYLSDFSNKYAKEEVKNDLRHVIIQHDYFFGDSKGERYNYKGYNIIDMNDQYVITDKHGTTVSTHGRKIKSKLEAEGIIDDLTKGIKDSLHNKNRKVKDGTFNFSSMGVLPMYCFQYLPDVEEAMDDDSECPKKKDFENEEDYLDALDTFRENYFNEVSDDWDILDEQEVEDLKNDLDDLNYDLENDAWEIENKENPSEEDLNLANAIRDLAKFEIEEGYYEGYQIYSKYAYRADTDLTSEWIEKIESKLNSIAKKYRLSQMAGGGWAGYHKVKDSKKK